jgi:Domain of unknown function (DUF4333)
VRRTGAIAVSLVAAGVLLLAGCSTSIDVDTLEQSVQTGLAEQLGGEWTVQCPDSMEVQAGLTTNCMATSAEGEAVDVNVTQTDDQGNVTWEVPATGIDVAAVESSVAADLAAQVGGEWTVQCPDDIPLEKGLTANCSATSADGQSTMIDVTQTDDQGNVTWATAG